MITPTRPMCQSARKMRIAESSSRAPSTIAVKATLAVTSAAAESRWRKRRASVICESHP